MAQQLPDAAISLEGEKVCLRPLTPADASEDYLGWLNDPEVLRYRGPKDKRSSMADIQRYIESIPERGDVVLAIRERIGERHVGNIALNSILHLHRSAELSIMIGAREVWGRGYGKESIGLLTRYGFEVLKLNRIWAESPNPTFNAAMKRLGWTEEGVKRQAFLLDDRFVDFVCWSILAHEFEGQQRKDSWP
ncbi:MAG: GNAT family N-acetyltransferase [Alphaproteobacteria bacterium]